MKKRISRSVIKKTGIIKALLLMKLTIILILLSSLQLSAKVYSQSTITLKIQSVKLSKALGQIEKNSSFRFLYNDDIMPVSQRVNINADNTPVTEVLDNLFSSTDLTYKILSNNLVVITRKNTEFTDVRVTGKITNSSGEAIPNASVRLKGGNTGTSTSVDGTYALTVPEGATLVFSSVGYVTQEIKVNGRTEIDVVLAATVKSLDEIVVVGYGSQRKIDVTGAVGQIKGEEISKQSSINALSALQGKVAGVQITNNGAPGSSPQIRIRGLGTISGSTNALYIVDGVWFDDISFLNPADIETMSILKDASSEAIYGIRAANGVVLVTTKKGKGKAKINYSGYIGVQQVTNQVKMSNGSEYAQLINELNIGNGGTAPFANPQSFGTATNWFDVVLRPAMTTNHHISVGGSGDRSTYNFSVGYLKQEGIIERNDYTRITARLQNDFTISNRLKMGYTATLLGSNSNDAPGGVIYKAFTAAPIVPVYYADGAYGDPGDFPIGSATNNPKIQLDFINQKSKTYRITANAFAEVKIIKDLTFRSSIGGEFGQGEVRNYNPVYTKSQGNSIQFNLTSKLSISRAETRNWIFENTLTYDKRIGEHKFKFLAGQSAQRYKSYFINGTADNVPYSSEGDLYLALGPNTVANPRTISDGGSLATYASYFGRVNYAFMDRYLLTASIRADGSSKFVGNQRWGYFPSVGVGWIVTDEKFMKNQKIFDNLKLRGSWGKIGNASVPSSITVQTVTSIGGYTAVYGGVGYPGSSIATLVPPYLYWERGVGTDIGLEGAVLNNKLNFEIDWYKRVTEQAIFAIPILGSIGTQGSNINGNQADIQNTGLEFSLGWKDQIRKNFTYSVNANFSLNNNKVTSVVTGNNPIYAGGAAATGGQLSTRTVAGQPIGQFYGLQVVGIFQTTAEIAASAQTSAKPGDFKYQDTNGDGKIDAKDRIVLGNPNPKYAYGFNTNFGYKQFDLTIDLQGVAGVQIYNANKGLRFGSENYSKDFYDNRWHGAGTSNSYPSANVGGGQNYLPNSWFVENGSYMRIRNIQLGYTLANSLISRLKIERVRFYVNAQNAFNFFSYKGFTPEVGGSATNGGIDNGVYPLSATYNFGVNVSF